MTLNELILYGIGDEIVCGGPNSAGVALGDALGLADGVGVGVAGVGVGVGVAGVGVGVGVAGVGVGVGVSGVGVGVGVGGASVGLGVAVGVGVGDASFLSLTMSSAVLAGGRSGFIPFSSCWAWITSTIRSQLGNWAKPVIRREVSATSWTLNFSG